MAKKSQFRHVVFRTDLFGHKVAPAGKVAAPKARCARCNKKFSRPQSLGRPRRYCSDECRKATWQDMATKFARAHRGETLSPGECRQCRKIIVVGRRRGRYPYFCSAECKRLYRHPTLPRGPRLFDDEA